MSNNLSIGTIWQDERTKKYFELVAHSKENNCIQLSTVDNEQSYTTMTEASLRKHYKLIALSMKQFRPETQVVTLPVEEPEEEVKGQSKPVKKTYTVTKIFDSKNDAIGKIHFESGKIMSANEYIAMHGKNGKDISGLTIHWIEKTKIAQKWLEEDKAKIFYTK
jgi:hypothetical protein